MRELSDETTLPIMTEVATPEHAELALKYGVDALWIGARTTANPFSMQQLADALQGVDIPVFGKNPIAPDLNFGLEPLSVSLLQVSHISLRYIADSKIPTLLLIATTLVGKFLSNYIVKILIYR